METGDSSEQVTQARLRRLRLVLREVTRQRRDPELTSDALRVSVVAIHEALFTCW